MKVKIDISIISQFPETKIGLLIGENLNNTNSFEEITTLLQTAEKELRSNYSLENLATIPKIIDWREAYRAFGFKPSEYRSSVEALIRRILQGKELPSINPLVDLYNLISIKHILPAGGGDLNAIVGTIILTTAQGNEQFVMLGNSEPILVKHGEVIYRDKQDVLCRAWNYRESDKTKITPDTKNVYLLLEGLHHTSNEEIMNALSELNKLVSKYCGGTFKQFLLNKENIEVSF